MQTLYKTTPSADLTAAIHSQPINAYLGWQIFLSRVFKQGTDKGLWLHWYHPLDEGRKGAVRYGHFIGPNQTLEDALNVVYQSIEAVIELESMEYIPFPLQTKAQSERYCHAASA